MSMSTADDSDGLGWAGESLLRRSWSVGKKVAVAGAALSVAPVVIPPLLMFSAFGLALSVPFGVYYVGVVGTERLMQSLLPLDREQDQEKFGDLDENWDREGEGEDYDEIELQGEGYVGENGGTIEEEEEEEEDIGDINAANKEDDDVAEENGEIENDNVIVERMIYVTSATVDDSDSVTIMQIEITPDDEEADVTTAVAEEGPELAGNSTEVNVNVDDKGIVTGGTGSEVAKKEENESSAVTVSSEGADASEAEDFNAVASASSESSVTSDVEEFYTKKELWEQLRALRTIVGYRAAIAKTLPGELRALYTFTGVDFPLTATDASNLLDLNYKLQFLKSIIGIK